MLYQINCTYTNKFQYLKKSSIFNKLLRMRRGDKQDKNTWCFKKTWVTAGWNDRKFKSPIKRLWTLWQQGHLNCRTPQTCQSTTNYAWLKRKKFTSSSWCKKCLWRLIFTQLPFNTQRWHLITEKIGKV